MYDWHVVAGSTSGVLIFISVLPYIRDILKGKTKPNSVTWFGWTLLMAIGLFAQINEGASFSVLLLAGDTLATGTVFALSLKRGVAKYTILDKTSLAFGLMAIILWVITKNPLTALVISVVADFIVSVPTLRKAIYDPLSETPSTFFIGAIAAFLGFVSTTQFNLANTLFPIYLLLSNTFIAVFSLRGRLIKK